MSDDEARPGHDDGLCTELGCSRAALMMEGNLISYCREHLNDYGVLLAADLKYRPNVVHSALLSLRERAWLPQSAREMAAEWPNVTKVEAWSGFFVYQLNTGEDWTWRSVAVAMRAFPDRPVRLTGNWLTIPQAPL